ncbi:unnamed protein product [Owenia fusiformis]|uniref:Uncharacterized protein n=1 Tax=Owenia fusiformis TaxID=6347 RepID=A0A8J1T8H9_OWEFU|nr:unnamed protein product [Owenia fusiformis]
MKVLILSVLATLALGAPGVIHMQQRRHQYKEGVTIEETLRKYGISTLLKLAKDAGLPMGETGPFTVFAPTDEAFSTLSPQILRELEKDKELLKNVLLYHIVGGSVMSNDITNEMTAQSMWTGHDIRFNIYKRMLEKDTRVTADGSPIIIADIKCSNGVIHIIDRVMYPIPSDTAAAFVAGEQKEFSTLLTALTKANLVDTLKGKGPFTVFAPTDEAFKRLKPGVLDHLLANVTLLKSVLEYHVVSGTFFSDGFDDQAKITTLNGKSVIVRLLEDIVVVNTAFVQYPDNVVTNGVVHGIQAVLMPPNVHLQLVES